MTRKDLAPGDPGGWPLIQSFQTELNRMFDRFNASPLGVDQQLMPVIEIAKPTEAAEAARKIKIDAN